MLGTLTDGGFMNFTYTRYDVSFAKGMWLRMGTLFGTEGSIPIPQVLGV